MTWDLPKADTYFKPLLDKTPRGFQIDHLDVALKHCRAFRLAVDGGAHIGTWSNEMARCFDRVIAFEPALDTFRCLVRNVGHHPNVQFQNFALGEQSAAGFVHDDPTRSGNTGSRFVTPVSNLAKVPALSAITIVPLDQFEFPALDLLKLDVEGSELPALLGAQATIRLCQPVIVIEVKKLRADHNPMLAVQWLATVSYREIARAGNDYVFIRD